MVFKPGQSGNPSGRPKVLEEFKNLCRKNSVDALTEVIKILKNEKSKNSDKLKAAEMILDRAYGKPIQEVKGMQLNQFAQIWQEAAKKAENVDGTGKVNIRHKKQVKA